MKDEAPALELIRHDLAHIMARAVQELWPDVRVTPSAPVRAPGRVLVAWSAAAGQVPADAEVFRDRPLDPAALSEAILEAYDALAGPLPRAPWASAELRPEALDDRPPWQALVPEVTAADLEPTHAGVRAQALNPDGSLVDDFLIVHGPNSLHVVNAPSPAATASLPKARPRCSAKCSSRVLPTTPRMS